MRSLGLLFVLPLVVLAVGLATLAAGVRRDDVPMVCDAFDAGPREHVRTSWDIDLGGMMCTNGGAATECPRRKDACPSVESWRCYPTSRPDIKIVGMEYCSAGWRESLDGGGP